MARANPDRQKDLAKKLEQGKFTIRDWREQLSNIMNMYVFHPPHLASYAYSGCAGALSPRSPP